MTLGDGDSNNREQIVRACKMKEKVLVFLVERKLWVLPETPN